MTVSSRRKKRVQARPGPPGGKRDENRKRKTRALQDASVKLFLERGVESVTIDEIVDAARTAKGSFYRYFADKAALVAAIFEPLRERMAEAFDACAVELEQARPREELNDVYLRLAARIGASLLDSPDTVRLYLQECRGPAIGARIPIREIADRIDERAVFLTKVAHDRGLMRPFDGRISSQVVVGAAEKLALSVLTDKDVGNPLAVPEALISLILDGVRPKQL